MATQEVTVPDIGDFKDIPVIQVFVKAGDEVKKEDPLVSLESDKATMDIPSPASGKVKEGKLKVGDRVGKGSAILVLEIAEASAGGTPQKAPAAQRSAGAAPRQEARGWKEKVVNKLSGGLGQLAKQRKLTVVTGVVQFLDAHHVEVTAGGNKQVVKFDQCIIAVGSRPVKLPFLPPDPRIIDSTGAL